MSFLNPWLLAGIAGIASPIIIHLLAKKRVQRVIWAAMRFLKVTVDKQQKRMTLEDIVLLILRCLVIALLAFALARPTLRSSSFGGLGGDEAALILLDVSGSMSTNDGVESRFDRARKAAEQVIDSLPGGAAVAVWLVSDTVRDSVPEPTHDFALARRAVRDAKRSDQGTEWVPAIRRAMDVLQRQPALVKQLYVITDSQAGGWKGAAELRGLLDAAKSQLQLRVVSVADGEQRNVAVSGLRLASALATINQPLRFEVALSNFGPEAVQNVSVSLSIDSGEPQDEQTLDTLPIGGEPRAVSLYVTFREAGFRTVTARIRGDRSPFDDQRSYALRVLDEVNVLLVDGDSGSEPRESEVFYLRNALTPVPEDRRDQYFIKTKTIPGSALENTVLSDFEVAVLANVVDLSIPATTALEQYVRGGGGLIVFPGSRINTAFYNEQMVRTRPLLPAEFGSPRGQLPAEGSADRPKDYFSLQSKDYRHRIVEIWKDPRSGTLSTAQFYRAINLLPASRDNLPPEIGTPSTVLNFADGMPALMERTYGNGRVLQFASTADSAWTDLPVRPLFLPLMHRSLGYLLARQEDRLNIRTGTTFLYSLDADLAGKDTTFVAPGVKRETARPQKIELKNNAPVLQYADTSLGGRYEAAFAEDVRPAIRFAAWPPTEESNLAEMTSTDFVALGDAAQVIRWSPNISLHTTLTRERTGTELWFPIALAVLLLAIAETFLGNRWSRSR